MRAWMLAALLLGACTPEKTPVAAPTPPVQPEAEAKPKPVLPLIVIADEARLPAAPDGGITAEGWSVIRIGMTLDELNAAVGEKLDPTQDDSFEEYQCTFLHPKAAPGPSVMYADGQVARIDVDGSGLATHGGLRVGDSTAKAREVFGAGLNAQPHFYRGLPSEYLTVWTHGGPQPPWNGFPSAEQMAAMEAARGIRFETDDNGVITKFYAGSGAIERVEGCL